MRKYFSVPLVTLLCVVPAVAAWKRADNELTLRPGSRLWITGTSTVRGFECTADSMTLKVASSDPHAVPALLAGQKAVHTAELTVVTARMNCHNDKMNDHMREALKAKEFSSILFTLTSYDLTKKTDTVTGTVTGELTLGGVKKTITLTGQAKPAADNMIRLTSTSDLRMTDYGLKPPSLMFGTMRVNPLVKVNFDLLLHE